VRRSRIRRFLLVIDLDGTILTNGEAPPEAHQLLDTVFHMDGGTVLATARPWKFVDSLGLRGLDAIISASGSLTHIRRFRIAQRSMTLAEIDEGLGLIAEHSPDPATAQVAFLGSEHRYGILAAGEGSPMYTLRARIAPPRELRIVEPEEYTELVRGAQVLSIAGITVGPPEASAPVSHEVNGIRIRTFNDRRFGDAIHWAEALPADVNKGTALLSLLGKWEDGDPPKIIAAGDAPVDLTMQPIVDMFVAPGDSAEPVRQAADVVADGSHGAEFCSYLIDSLPELLDKLV
jgi:hydroxymethylpyrimidine pyrophosphatase-like HAD family hydrolase